MGAGLKQTFQTPLTDVSLTQRDALGSLRLEDNKWYKYVKFLNTTATVAGAAGSLVGYFAATGPIISRVVADLSDADAIPICAGVTLAVITGTLLVPYYVWIQLTGPTTLDTAVGSGSAGKSFYLTTVDKTAAVGAAAYDQKAGLCLNGTTSVLLTCAF